MSQARRQLLDTRHGQMHARIAGAGGVPLVLLHFTPLSSLAFEPFVPHLAADRLVVAADRLGFGFSDPPPDGIPISEFALATLDALDGLGIGQFDLVGIHTGALEALEIATAHAGRVRRLGLVAIPIFSDEERQAWKDGHKALVREIAEDGSHLADYWKGVAAASEGRYPLAVRPTPPAPWGKELKHRFVLHFLLAGESAWKTLHAVFDYPVAERLPQVRQPLLVVRTQDDIWEQTGRAIAYLPAHARHVELAHLDAQAFALGAEELAALFQEFLDSP